jgi:simple sugar transport system permease protein
MIGHLFSAFVVPLLMFAVPYVLAATGGLLSERAGVINIALEGYLLVGAFMAAVGTIAFGPLAGVLLGMAGGAALAAVHALCTVRLRADQVVCGVALNLLASGLTRFLLKVAYGDAASSPKLTPGAMRFVVFAAAFVLVAVVEITLRRTRFGLRLRSVGEHPAAAASLGVSVRRVKVAAVLLAGTLGGLGGVWLCFAGGRFVNDMSGGRGYIALAAMIMGNWRPTRALVACLLFAAVEVIGLHLTVIPATLSQVLPHVMTLVVLSGLAGAIGRARPPAALGVPPE